MITGPKLTKSQWKLLASAFSNIAQAVILFSMAASLVPEAVGLTKDFSLFKALTFLIGGLFTLAVGVIIARKGKLE